MSGAIYARIGDKWHPHALTKGPYAGQHGGAVAGVLGGALEARAKIIQAGAPRQASCYLMHPAAIDPVEIEVEDIQRGDRVVILRAVMHQDDRQIAEATAVFSDIRLLPEVPAQEKFEQAPGTEEADIGDFSSLPWFKDAVEIKRDGKGWFWFRHNRPIITQMGPLGFTLSLASWTSAVSRPGWFGSNDVVGFPNMDLSVHLARAPEGEWLGLDGKSVWQPDGAGISFANLYDQRGFVGRAAQSILLVSNSDI